MKKIIGVLGFITLFSCKSENEIISSVENNKNKVKIIELDLTEDMLVSYSFEKNEIVEFHEEEIHNITTWDLAFLGLNGKTNGGSNGSGGVKVFRTHLKDFDKINNISKIVDSEDWQIDQFLEIKSYMANNEKAIKGNFQSLLVDNGWYVVDDTSSKINVLESVFVLKTSGNKYVKLQFLNDSDSSKLRFKWDFLNEEGSDDVNIYAHKLGEEVITGTQKVEKLLENKDLSSITNLKIVDKALSQTDLNFIRDNFPQLHVLDLTHTWLSLQAADKFLKDSKNIKHVILPINQSIINFGRLGYSNIEKVTFPGNKLTTIGNGVFSFSKIKVLELPNSLKILESKAFAMIPEIQYIEVPSKVSIIPDECFALNSKLESIKFKGRIRSLGDRVFSSCKNLKKLTFNNKIPPTFNSSDNPFYKDVNNKNIIKANSLTIYVPKSSIDAYLSAWNLDEDYRKYFKVL